MLAYSFICKDSASSLSFALRSLNSARSEIYINDTGSEDGTQHVANKYSDNVIQTQWNNSFAEARNAQLPAIQARKDINHFMWVDADDEVIYDERKALMLEDGVSYLVRLIDAYTKEECWQLRIIDNGPDVKWRYKVHEEVYGHGRVEKLFSVKVIHFGYLNTVVKKRKHQRNLELLMQDVDRREDGNYWFVRGLCHRELEDVVGAMSAFTKAYSYAGTEELKARICYERCLMYSDCDTQLKWLRLSLTHYRLVEVLIMLCEIDHIDSRKAYLAETVRKSLENDSYFPINLIAIRERIKKLV
jgi:glycosyltransferase involved in cell wall biosynthesis